MTTTDIVKSLILWGVLSILFFLYRAPILSVTKKQLFAVFSRLIISGGLLFFLCNHFNFVIIKALLPLFTQLLNAIQDDYTVILQQIDSTTPSIKVKVTFLRDIHPFKPGSKYLQFFQIGPLIQSIVLLPALLIAWPVKQALSRVLLVLFSLLLSLFILMINVPVQIAHSLETTFIKLESLIKVVRPEPFYQPWITFISQGGNLVLIIFLVILATSIQNKLITSSTNTIN